MLDLTWFRNLIRSNINVKLRNNSYTVKKRKNLKYFQPKIFFHPGGIAQKFQSINVVLSSDGLRVFL